MVWADTGSAFYDPTFILVIIGMVISLAASAYVKSTFNKYDKVRSKNNTGTKAAQYILQSQGINNVGVQAIAGDLTDNYNSGNKMLSLSIHCTINFGSSNRCCGP